MGHNFCLAETIIHAIEGYIYAVISRLDYIVKKPNSYAKLYRVKTKALTRSKILIECQQLLQLSQDKNAILSASQKHSLWQVSTVTLVI